MYIAHQNIFETRPPIRARRPRRRSTMHVNLKPSRRLVLRATAAALVSTGLLAGAALAQPAMPKSPVTINIVDPAGNLALTQDAIEAYQKSHSNLVSKFIFTKAPAPEIPGKLKAMQAAGRSDYDLVLTGTD